MEGDCRVCVLVMEGSLQCFDAAQRSALSRPRRGMPRGLTIAILIEFVVDAIGGEAAIRR